MTIGIYKYQNLLNGNIYIGQSSNIERRYEQHLYDAKNRPERGSGVDLAIQKYGIDNFSFEIIEECSIEDLNDKERYWIEYYDSYNCGYNRTPGGKSLYGEEHPRAILTEEQVWQIREDYKNLVPRKQVFDKFKNFDITERGLKKIWDGETWLHVHMDVYTDEIKQIRKKMVGHSEDQIGKSNEDKKIRQAEIDLWVQERENGMSINQIAKKYNRDNGIIQKYLNNPKEITKIKYKGRSVKNINTGRVFGSIKEAAKWSGCGSTTLTRHLSSDGIAGKVPETNEPAQWIEIS